MCLTDSLCCALIYNLTLDVYTFICSASTNSFCFGESQDWQGFLTCSLEHSLGQSEALAPVFESEGSDQLPRMAREYSWQSHQSHTSTCPLAATCGGILRGLSLGHDLVWAPGDWAYLGFCHFFFFFSHANDLPNIFPIRNFLIRLHVIFVVVVICRLEYF